MIKFEDLFNEALATMGGESFGHEERSEEDLNQMTDDHREDNKSEFIRAFDWMNDDDLWPTTPEGMEQAR